MSSMDSVDRGQTAVDVVAGFLAAFAIALSVVALAERPARLAPIAILVALLAARMSERRRRLALAACAAGALGWTLGMTFAVLTNSPIY
jgi:hypothetical protein